MSSPRIFNDLVAPPKHGDAPEDSVADEQGVGRGQGRTAVSSATFHGKEEVIHPTVCSRRCWTAWSRPAAGPAPRPAADSAALRQALPGIIDRDDGARRPSRDTHRRARPSATTSRLYPAIGLAGGACAGYGLLLDIRDPAHPERHRRRVRLQLLLLALGHVQQRRQQDPLLRRMGRRLQPKCRKTDKPEWGADAIFTIADRKMQFQSYYKLPAPQTPEENCVAHNGSLIPIPGRDVMVQAWYQGGLSVFDWTDATHPKEIAFFDRGPVDSTKLELGGYWSAYWYNGVIVGSEISRGLDIFELKPSGFISQNEIDAAKSVHLDYFNTQGQLKLVWPTTFSLARAYLDQLERSKGLDAGKIAAAREALAGAEKASGTKRQEALTGLASRAGWRRERGRGRAKVRTLAGALKELAGNTH